MIRLIGKLTLTAMLAGVIALTAGTVSAQTNAAPKTTNSVPKTNAVPAKPKATRFTGTIVSIDKTNKTITVGVQAKHVYQVTSATKLTKTGKPVAFDDYAVGEDIVVNYGQTADGKFEARGIASAPPKPAKKVGGTTTPGAASASPAPAGPPTVPKQP